VGTLQPNSPAVAVSNTSTDSSRASIACMYQALIITRGTSVQDQSVRICREMTTIYIYSRAADHESCVHKCDYESIRLWGGKIQTNGRRWDDTLMVDSGRLRADASWDLLGRDT